MFSYYIATLVLLLFSLYKSKGFQLRSNIHSRNVFVSKYKKTILHDTLPKIPIAGLAKTGLIINAFDVPPITTKDGKKSSICSIGMPRVLPPGKPEEEWLLWFHGRDTEMNDNNIIALSTGRIYLASSPDGISNFKFHEDSPVIVPSKEAGDWFYFDSEHVGLGDVILPGGEVQSKFATQDGVFLMYIFGGNSDKKITQDKATVIGSKIEIGVAVSQDGIHWSRVEGPSAYGSIVEVGESPLDFDSTFVGWPNVVEVDRKFYMYYHSYCAVKQKFVVGMATATDGMKWSKVGAVFEGSTSSSDKFDSKGVSCRHVVKMKDGTYRMWYQGISNSNISSIGVATSNDGIRWNRLSDESVFSGSLGLQDWDGGGVGQPNLIWQESSNTWRMYYIGIDKDGNESGIGIVESTDAEGLIFKRMYE